MSVKRRKQKTKYMQDIEKISDKITNNGHSFTLVQIDLNLHWAVEVWF